MQPSPQQSAIFSWVSQGRGNAIIEAVAGAGKTTTLVHALKLMKGSVAFAAYNRKIADEIRGRIPEGAKNIRAGTFHSFGMSAWLRAYPDCKVDHRKTDVLMEQAETPENFRNFVKAAVSLAKQRAMTPQDGQESWLDLVAHFELEDTLVEDMETFATVDDMVQTGVELARKVLRLSIEQDPVTIDFDDMIYAPLIHNCRIWQNQWVLIDEAQDTNPARRALAKRMLAPGGRLIAVGDPHQAIYGFTGADNDSLELIREEFQCTQLPLTITYRCPKAVVEHAQQWVHHIEAADTAPQGMVREVLGPDFLKLVPEPMDVILCRNTKPLVELAYDYLRRGIPCHVEGKDIGRGLLVLARKWKVRKAHTLLSKLDQYAERETQRFMARKQEAKAAAVNDKVATLKIIISGLAPEATIQDLSARIGSLFQDSDDNTPSRLTLSTVHKSKGREWERVWLYGRNKYMPSGYARQPWQLQQEDNLCYVAVTRAKHELIEVKLG